MKKIIFLLVIFLFNFAITFGQIDSCWDVVLQHNPELNIFNPDSVLYDTCLCKEKPWLPPYCEYVYAKQWFGLHLPIGALNIPQAPRDSIILRNWMDIDSSFTEMRAGFEILENLFGNFVFMKVYPDDVDTNSIGSRFFKIRFDNYVKIDSASKMLDSIDRINGTYLGRYNYTDVYDSIYNYEQKSLKITPNPCNNSTELNIIGSFIMRNKIQVFTQQGIIIFNKRISELNFSETIPLNTSEYPSGVYFIKYGNIFELLIVLH